MNARTMTQSRGKNNNNHGRRLTLPALNGPCRRPSAALKLNRIWPLVLLVFMTLVHIPQLTIQSGAGHAHHEHQQQHHHNVTTSKPQQTGTLDEEIPFDSWLIPAPTHQINKSRQATDFLDPFGATFEEYLRDSAQEQQQQQLEQADQAPPAKQHHHAHSHPSTTTTSTAAISVLGQLFAWKVLPTNKCSRPCGRGKRVNHISCSDRKYDVRVEDELCLLKLNKEPKPAELSEDEFCNEFDCPPAWLETGDHEQSAWEIGKPCNESMQQHHNHNQHHHQHEKRCECVVLTSSGQRVKVDESRCNQASQLGHQQATRSQNETVLESTTTTTQPGLANEELVKFEPSSLDEVSLEDINLNSILQDADSTGNQLTRSLGHQHHQHHRESANVKKSPPPNEPFFEPLEWGPCQPTAASQEGAAAADSGNSCGQLGVRQRELACRMFLSKSSKVVELSGDSCESAATSVGQKPETEEPCYLDCNQYHFNLKPQNETTDSLQTVATDRPTEFADETVYDLEMTRYEWRLEGWTKCNAECLGGQRESLVECWDKVLLAPVEHSMCEPDLKPHPRVESCNAIPCQVEWRYEPYSNCSRSCGVDGLRPRHLKCVQKTNNKFQNNANNEPIMSWNQDDNETIMQIADDDQQENDESSLTRPYYVTVPLELCHKSISAGPAPDLVEPCNRFNCPPEWVSGPWSSCDAKCGPGSRTRNVTCVQELGEQMPKYPSNLAPPTGQIVSLSGHLIQVPFERCFAIYKTIPPLQENCYGACLNQLFIDSHKDQDLELNGFAGIREKKTISLRVGGQARLVEGMNLKLRCKVMKRVAPEEHAHSAMHPRLVKRVPVPIEWRFDGEIMFPNGSSISDKRSMMVDSPLGAADDDVFENDISLAQAMQADAPAPNENAPTRTQTQPHAQNAHPHHSVQPRVARLRNLSVRSWNVHSIASTGNSENQLGEARVTRFVADPEGRFSLSRENTLKIKRLRSDDSGRYRCSYGNLTESLDLYVASPIESDATSAKFATSQDKARAENELAN